MSEIGSGGSTYPVSLPTNNAPEFDKALANRTKPDAQLLNDIKDEIVGLAAELGLALKGSAADLATRLANYINANGTFKNGKLVIGSTSYPTLSDAITALTSAGGELFLPKGTENIVTTTQEIKTKSRLSGSGKSSILTNTGGTTQLLKQDTDDDLDGASFDNLELDGASPDIPTPTNTEHAHAIGLYAVGQTSENNIVGPNIWIKDVGGDGVYIRKSDKNILHALNIDVNWQEIGANLTGRNGIAITEGDSLIISNCYIRRAANAGIDLEPNTSEDISRVVINNCIIEDCLYGIAIPGGGGASPPINHVAISNCIIRIGDKSATGFNANTNGILLQEVETVILNNIWVVGQDDPTLSGVGILIDNCSRINLNNVNVTKCERGLRIFSDNGANDKISIIGGEFSENEKHGLSLDGTSGNHIGHLIVKGVQAFNNDNSAAGFDGIRVGYADHVLVEGCMAYDDQGTETQDSGINIHNSGNVIVVGNECYGNTGTQIRLATNTLNEYGHNIGAVTIV